MRINRNALETARVTIAISKPGVPSLYDLKDRESLVQINECGVQVRISSKQHILGGCRKGDIVSRDISANNLKLHFACSLHDVQIPRSLALPWHNAVFGPSLFKLLPLHFSTRSHAIVRIKGILTVPASLCTESTQQYPPSVDR